jgi:hypothetical protein
VLVVERGGCERSSPAGHGWPAEWARKEAFKLWATFDVGRIAKNPPDSRTFASLDRSSHPQTERRARKRPVYMMFGEESEAVDYAAGAGELWGSVPGAVAWLES